jgi:hypothetical protein
MNSRQSISLVAKRAEGHTQQQVLSSSQCHHAAIYKVPTAHFSTSEKCATVGLVAGCAGLEIATTALRVTIEESKYL